MPITMLFDLLRLMHGKELLLIEKLSNQFVLLNMFSAINNQTWCYCAIYSLRVLLILNQSRLTI